MMGWSVVHDCRCRGGGGVAKSSALLEPVARTLARRDRSTRDSGVPATPAISSPSPSPSPVSIPSPRPEVPAPVPRTARPDDRVARFGTVVVPFVVVVSVAAPLSW